MPRSMRGTQNDPVLLVEAGLLVLLIGLFIFLYIVPTERQMDGVSWWAPVLLGGLSLTVLLLDRWRRRRKYRRSMGEVIEQHLGGRDDEEDD